MIFSFDQIDKMSEQDVREEIIARIVDRLGYRYGRTYYCERERKLTYPYFQIGHRSKRDIPLGSADYLCGIDGKRGSFSIEAKRGNLSIGKPDIIQAHSYAAHFEIGAKFFVVCNGHRFQVFETSGGIDRAPLIDLSNSEFENSFSKIEAILSPENLERYSRTEYELTKPIAEGYGRVLIIKNGWVTYDSVGYSIPGQPPGAFENLLRLTGKLGAFQANMNDVLSRRQPIVSGVIKRDDKGRIFAHAEFDSADELMANNLSAMGLVEFTFLTDSEYLSAEEGKQTAFESLSEREVSKGTRISDSVTRQIESMGLDSKMSLYFRCLTHLTTGGAVGRFISMTHMSFLANGAVQLELSCNMAGSFTLNFKP